MTTPTHLNQHEFYVSPRVAHQGGKDYSTPTRSDRDQLMNERKPLDLRGPAGDPEEPSTWALEER